VKADWQLFERIAPDIFEIVERRYHVLQNIYWHEPIGRRTLAEKLDLTERVLRTETDFLRNQELLTSDSSGMKLTILGLKTYQSLEIELDSLFGMREIESKISKKFGIRRTIVVPGDCDENENLLYAFGSKLSDLLNEELPSGENVLAVMGGTTMAKIAESMNPIDTLGRKNTFVPARGGIGEAVDSQANAVGAVMAANTKGKHRALYVPEQVSPQTYELLIKEPAVQEVLFLIKHANCVIHSIGKAMQLARRRKFDEDILLLLKQRKAVAESFGFFFDEKGKMVYKMVRIGLQLEQLQKVPLIYAVAGGKSKAKVVKAYMINAPKQTCLIIDEACANKILRG
jgi:central glycolytic genes regulator